MVIVDIDGVLAQLGPWRSYAPELDEENNRIIRELKPNAAVIKLVNTLHQSGYTITLMTGRPIRFESSTLSWIIENDIPFDYMFFREHNDISSDADVKSKMLDDLLTVLSKTGLKNAAVDFVIEDRNSVVAMWRRRGLLCLQTANVD